MRVVVVFFFLSTCSVQCHFMNIALDHQMKALRNEKKNSEFKVRKDKKRACKLNTSSFFLSHIFTNVLKLLTSLKKRLCTSLKISWRIFVF